MSDKAEIITFLQEVSEAVRSATSSTVRTTGMDALIHQVFIRCLSTFDAIVLLLDHDHFVEAVMLLRPLLNDAQIFMDLRGVLATQRTARVMEWRLQHLNEIERRLASAAERAGEEAEQVLRRISEESADLDRIRERLDLDRWPTIPREGMNRSGAVGRPEDEVDWVMSSQFSHSGMASLNFHAKVVEAGSVAVTPTHLTPRSILALGSRATEYLSEAAVAVSSMLEWETEQQIGSARNLAYQRLADLHRQHSLKPSDAWPDQADA